MEHTLGQLQLEWRFLTTFRTRLTRMLRWHLMEMFTIAFCHPSAPIKEHPPRGVRDGLGKMAVLHHIAGVEALSDNDIKTFVVKKFVDGLGDKVKTLARDNIVLLCQSVFRLIPAFTPILLYAKGRDCKRINFCSAW